MSLHINILFAILRTPGHVIYLSVMQKVTLDTLQTANLDFAKNSAFCVHISCYMVLVMINPIICWDTKTSAVHVTQNCIKTAYIQTYIFYYTFRQKCS